MILSIRGLALALSSLFVFTVTQAQITITNPVPRMVIQRNQQNQASVLVTGTAPANASLVEARLIPLAVGQGATTAWTMLNRLTGSTAFRGRVTATAGWYRLQVRAKSGSTVLTETYVNRVGVGEVFVIAGQSNMVGGFERQPGAEEDRVSCLDFRQEALDEQLLPFRFSNVSHGSNIGPSHPPHIWGRLGDRLVRRLNVPVLFLGAATPGTSSDQWRQSAEGGTVLAGQPLPYRRLGVVLQHYVARTGLRAVLWHQGEGDLGSSNATYFNNLRAVIQKSRQQTSSSALAWMMSRVSYVQGQTNPDVIAAQNRLIAEVPNVFTGPATDDLTGSGNRPDGVHFGSEGLIRFIDRWDQSLNSDFFSRSVPFTPTLDAALLTSAYTLPLDRRPGETVLAPSLRNDPNEPGNQYVAQLLRASDGQLIVASSPSTINPLSLVLPANLPDGQYRLRTVSTLPALTGTLGEPFNVRASAPATNPDPPLLPPVRAGLPDPALLRFGYSYDAASHGFYALVRADALVEVRLQRVDGGWFGDSDWHYAPPSSQSPDYAEFADFTHVRNYPPIALAVGGVEPGQYRLSVRRQGDTGAGLAYEMRLLNGRNILFMADEPVASVPPVLTLTGLSSLSACPNAVGTVAFEVTGGGMGTSNRYTVLLSNANGSFATSTTISTGPASPLSVQLPASLPTGSGYRIRVEASHPAVGSAPSEPLPTCSETTNRADLALTMQMSQRTLAVGQAASCLLRLRNTGPADAPNVIVTSRLPTHLTFVDATTSQVTAASAVVTINVGTLPANATRDYTIRLRATQSGTFFLTAQVTASPTPDPDSQPNSGTGDGQDDGAAADLRTADGAGPLSVSPNPNQTPLPAVESNQPATDPSKADLSLTLSANRLTLPVSGTANFTLSVSNRGGSALGSATVQVLLPTDWQLTSTGGFTVNGQTVTATLSNIAVDGTARLSLPVRVGSSGTLRAQVSQTAVTDPDSTPGNGFQNGEDDQTGLSVRTVP